jgi:manganese/zinc/iron transport system ATP- binding protein
MEGHAAPQREGDRVGTRRPPLNGAPASPRTTAPHEAPLSVRGYSCGYGAGEPDVVRGATFALGTGTLNALVGPNGAGKSTLLKGLLGLLPIAPTGEALFFGRPFAAARARVAFVPQRAEIDWSFPASALEVATMGFAARLGVFRRPGREGRAAAMRALETVGLADAARAQIGELSGGQQQRVLVARALAADAELLLLDEPFANADAAAAGRLLATLRALAREGRTVLAVHHDLAAVRAHFDRAIVIAGGIAADGAPREVLEPSRLAQIYGISADAS